MFVIFFSPAANLPQISRKFAANFFEKFSAANQPQTCRKSAANFFEKISQNLKQQLIYSKTNQGRLLSFL